MDGRFQPRQRSHDHNDRRFEQWIETGRQFVDGVAGTRPGRRNGSGSRSPMDLETVGRWVGDKIDWLMDEEEDWRDPVPTSMEPEVPVATSRKRPLDAISRRQAVLPAPQPTLIDDDSWPDDDSFRVERWSRSAASSVTASREQASDETSQRLSRGPTRRPLPRSSRRRN